MKKRPDLNKMKFTQEQSDLDDEAKKKALLVIMLPSAEQEKKRQKKKPKGESIEEYLP